MLTDATRPSASGTSFLLGELKDAHAALIGAIEELKQLADGPVPPKDELVSARWNISKASLHRRLLWGRIHAHISGHVDAKGREVLQLLQEADTRLLRYSTEHVGRWTADAILQDWQGYCRASRQMRQKMLEAIGTEERILYPILETAGPGQRP